MKNTLRYWKFYYQSAQPDALAASYCKLTRAAEQLTDAERRELISWLGCQPPQIIKPDWVEH